MDFSEDTSHQILHALNKATGIDLVKTAEASDEDTEGLPSHSFADPYGRKFPVHTKNAAILSAAYAEYSEAGPEVRQRIKEAADFWDCKDLVETVQREIQAFRPEEKWALDMEIDGQPVRAFGYSTAASLKKAATDFWSQRHRLPYAARKSAAVALKKAAASLQADLEPKVADYLDNVLGIGIPSPERAEQMLLVRKKAGDKQGEWDQDIQKLAQAVGQLEDPDEKSGEEMVQKFAAFDEAHGIAPQYETGVVELPEDRLFPVSYQKLASAAGDLVELQNGMVVDLQSLDWEKVSEVDPELYEACDKGDLKTAAEVLPTWPRSDVEILAQMLDLKAVI